MPDVNWDFGEMYAGSFPLDDNPSGNATEQDALFFIFKPRDGEPVDEVTIWLNGGPGCSSLEGYLQENGPILWQPGTYLPIRNPYAWSNLTNMIWVDQPVGTGFSTGKPTATSQEDIAADFLVFFKKFQDTFGIKNFKIYITGESYAGRYVPYIAGAMIDSNNTENFDVGGILVYDPVIGNFDYVQEEVVAYPHIEANWNLYGFNQSYMASLKQLHQQCGYEDFINKYMQFPPPEPQPALFWNYSDPKNASCDLFNIALEQVLSINPCFNPYEIVSLLCTLTDSDASNNPAPSCGTCLASPAYSTTCPRVPSTTSSAPKSLPLSTLPMSPGRCVPARTSSSLARAVPAPTLRATSPPTRSRASSPRLLRRPTAFSWPTATWTTSSSPTGLSLLSRT